MEFDGIRQVRHSLLALVMRLGRYREVFCHAQITNNELINLQASDSRPANSQPTDCQSTKGHGTERDRA